MSAPSPTEVSQVVKRSPLTPSVIRLLGTAAVLPVSLAALPEAAWAQNPASFIPVDLINATPPGGTVPNTITGVSYSPTCDARAVSFPGCLAPDAITNLTYGDGGNRELIGVEGDDTGGTVFTFSRITVPNEVLLFQRSEQTPARDILFFESTSVSGETPPANINLSPQSASSLVDALLSIIINRGIDNVFDNAGNPPPDEQNTLNNIERIDFILPDGIIDDPTDTESLAFLVLERGGNDRFYIAPITSVVNGQPATYGTLQEVAIGDWQASNSLPFESVVLEREADTGTFLPSHRVPNQSVEGILFPINLLAPDPGNTPIFGYSLFAGDTLDNNGGVAPPPGPTLANIADTTFFPRDTEDTSAEGGLDLVAAGFGTLTTQAISTSFTLTPNTDLTTQVGVPVDHPFTVTNTGATPGTITLTTIGTDPGYTAEIIDPATNTVVTDTGVLQPGASIEYVLRVTPDATATTIDTTTVRGTDATNTFQEVIKTTRIANFTIDPPGQLRTDIGVPVDHPFTVTNTGTTPDTITLTTEGTSPNYTTQIIDPATGTVVTDTGTLAPGASTNLILRVTPQPGATTNDTTLVRGTSVDNGATLTVEKTTLIQDANFVMTPDSDLFTSIGRPARHDFEVTVIGATPDTIDLTTSGTDPNYTVQIINRVTGAPLTDTDGDGTIDTGSLNPNEPAQLTLLATPQPGAPLQDTTVIQGTDSTGGTQQVTKITRLANFSITDNGELQTPIGQPVDHPFTVTNTGISTETINLVPEGTNPNYTVEFIDPRTGNPLTDTNGDNIPDTGPLAPTGTPGDTVDLILRVTPGPNASSPDTTTIRGTAVGSGNTLTITRITRLPDSGAGNISLTKRITRVFRVGTGQLETYDAVNPTSLPPGFVGVTSPTPQELSAGDLVEYTIYYANDSTGQVTDLEICDPIPTESSFLADPTVVPAFQDGYGNGEGIAFDVPSTLPLGSGDALSNVFDGDQGEYVNPLTPRASCPGETSGDRGAVVVRVGTVAPGEAGFIKFVTQLE